MATLVLFAGSSLAQAPPATLVHETPALFLVADGTLGPSPGQGAGTPCLALGPTAGGVPSIATFTGRLRDGPYRILGDLVVVPLALSGAGGPAQAGTGAALRGALRFGDAPPIRAEYLLPPGATASEARLEFVIQERHLEAQGPVALSLLLESEPGPVAIVAAEDIQVRCDHEGSYIRPFAWAAGGAGATDVDGNAVPDAEEAAASPGAAPVDVSAVLGSSAVAALAVVAGGGVVLAGRTVSERRLHLLLGLTGGLLLAIAVVDLVPEALELSGGSAWTVALVVLALYGFRWLSGDSGHAHGPGHGTAHRSETEAAHHGHAGAHAARLAWITFAALGIHTFIDGVILPAAFQLDSAVGLTVLGGIFAHLFPDGMAGATVFLAASWTRGEALRGVGAIALFTVVGAVAGLVLLGLPGLIGHLVALAAGTFIFIALSEIVPELQRSPHRALVAVGVLAGYALAFGVETLARAIAGA